VGDSALKNQHTHRTCGHRADKPHKTPQDRCGLGKNLAIIHLRSPTAAMASTVKEAVGEMGKVVLKNKDMKGLHNFISEIRNYIFAIIPCRCS
jgi:hypothetical protein